MAKVVEAGVILFEKYEVEEIEFKLNPSYEEEEVEVDVNMEVECSTDSSREHMKIKLKVHIFKDAPENKYPFEMIVSISGYFIVGMDASSDITHYQANAVAILYPYIRALVSTYTSAANVSPLILPTINVNKFLESQSQMKD